MQSLPLFVKIKLKEVTYSKYHWVAKQILEVHVKVCVLNSATHNQTVYVGKDFGGLFIFSCDPKSC
jgi:hypothetical protein